MLQKRMVWVTFDRVGFHCYPGAPDEVSYLRERHRHKFFFKVSVEVFHDDRDIEFHMLLNQIEQWYSDGSLELDYKSCEMMADELFVKLQRHFIDEGLVHKDRQCVIEVSEDRECGAVSVYVLTSLDN